MKPPKEKGLHWVSANGVKVIEMLALKGNDVIGT